MTRISVANLVAEVTNTSTNQSFVVGFLNRKSISRGDPAYTALGGAALLTSDAMLLLADKYGAVFEKGNDARFHVTDADADQVLQMLEGRDHKLIELSLEREMREELCGLELPGQEEPVLLESDLDSAAYIFLKHVRQISDEAADEAIHRLFFLYEMKLPDHVFKKLAGNQYIKLLSADEILKGRSTDGKKIGGNLGLM